MSPTGRSESVRPAFLQGKQPGRLEARVPEGGLPNAGWLRAASFPCNGSGQEEVALLRRASEEEVFLLLVSVMGKDQLGPASEKPRPSYKPVASSGVSSGGFSGQLFLYLKAIFQGHLSG